MAILDWQVRPSWHIGRDQIISVEHGRAFLVHPFTAAHLASTGPLDRLKRVEAIVIAEVNRKADRVIARLEASDE